MIQAQELRIGNWAYDTRRVSVGPNIKIPFQINVIDNKNYTYLESIPIFPEILEKAGFEYRKQFNHYSKPFKQGRFNIGKSVFDDDVWYLCDYKTNISCEFKYVHQLQNIFFALTSEEVEITFP